MSNQISSILKGKNKDEKQHNTVFSALLDSDLPPSELSQTRLEHEAISVTGAGIETTMRALSVASFHIIANPPIFERLREELVNWIPDPSNPPSWDELNQAPYLSACIEEGTHHPLQASPPARLTKSARSSPPRIRHLPASPPCLRRHRNPLQILGYPRRRHRQHGQLCRLARRKHLS